MLWRLKVLFKLILLFSRWPNDLKCSLKWAVELLTHFHLAGMPFTTGMISRRGVVATVDSPVVALLKRAGAIPLGVTNTSELCMWLESNNHLYGITNNPYDFERIAGGSSGEQLVTLDSWCDSSWLSRRISCFCGRGIGHCWPGKPREFRRAHCWGLCLLEHSPDVSW